MKVEEIGFSFHISTVDIFPDSMSGRLRGMNKTTKKLNKIVETAFIWLKK